MVAARTAKRVEAAEEMAAAMAAGPVVAAAMGSTAAVTVVARAADKRKARPTRGIRLDKTARMRPATPLRKPT